MPMIGQVPQSEVGSVTGSGEQKQVKFGNWWMNWFNQSYSLLFSIQQSGTTAQRPTKNIWVGRFYFDTTLGYPVWVVQATPTIVWVNASGITV